MDAGAFTASFLASAVEAIEMVAIVVAVGVARGWRSSLAGAGAGLLALLVLSFGFGTALSALPIDALRLVVGALLLIFGLQWLAKGIRRVAAHGLAGYHEDDLAPTGADRRHIDWGSFVISFKGVLLEGLEIAFIAVSVGATASSLASASAGAGSALVLVALLGAVSHRAISRIPRSVLILAVGVMLSSFGSFWGVEGTGVTWPGGEAALPVLAGCFSLFALTAIWSRRQATLRPAGA